MLDFDAMNCSFLSDMAHISADAWNRLSGPQPFLRHEFLSALEKSGSVGPGTGWQNESLMVYEGSVLQALVPLYRKTHSYGEFVFDWAWARAYAQAGLRYYPKLISAVPFTPATGHRLLLATEKDRAEMTGFVGTVLRERAQATGASSVHWLFPTSPESDLLQGQGFLRRTGFQFHWTNEGWASFEDFLSALSAPKRKNIKRERRQVRDAGVCYSFYEGEALHAGLLDAFYDLYVATISKYGSTAYLTRPFFSLLADTVPGVVLLMATVGSETVAGALFFRDEQTLYGRYWGALASISGLHFETCYYQALDYCFTHGLRRFEAGAQGPHKLSRGFLPVPTYSLHWLCHAQFNHAVADFLRRENDGLEYTLNELKDHSPFHKMS